MHTLVCLKSCLEVVKKPAALQTTSTEERRLRKNAGSKAYHATFNKCEKTMGIEEAKLEACRQSDIAKKVYDDSLVSDMAAESA